MSEKDLEKLMEYLSEGVIDQEHLIGEIVPELIKEISRLRHALHYYAYSVRHDPEMGEFYGEIKLGAIARRTLDGEP